MNADNRDHTFVFADLAGFTALTEAHGDEAAADIALDFCRAVNCLLPDDAQDVKMLGDSCLLRFGSARDAVEVGLRLTGDLSRRCGLPDVRVGMHTGSAVRRGDDWFGSTVNIAARVAAIAGPREVLVTSQTRVAAGAMEGVDFHGRGERELRHVPRPVGLAIARKATDYPEPDLVLDPVCRMRVDLRCVVESLQHDGAQVAFCSATCAELFRANPTRYSR